MSLALVRLDDRLIHGQVVVGWGQPLNAAFIVLVDDEVRGSEWEQDLYRMGVPANMEVVFASVSEAERRLPEWEADDRPGILLTGDTVRWFQDERRFSANSSRDAGAISPAVIASRFF